MIGNASGSGSWLLLARRVVQTTVLVLVILTGYRMTHGASEASIERFCPFGGIETAYALLTGGTFTCATGSGNLTILVALLVLTLLARKSFCSWVCPVGTVSEWITRATRTLKQLSPKGGWNRAWRYQILGLYAPPPAVDRAFRWLRLPVLLVILALTFRSGELIFRPFDPYYVLFSFHGHDVQAYSYVILAALLVLAVWIPMAWCRYLCPLGAVLWPFARVGALRIGRDEATCTGCRACDLACPHSIEVSRLKSVNAGECTLCLECTEACPSSTTLSLRSTPAVRNANGWVVPAVVVLLAIAGMAASNSVRIPSATRTFSSSVDAEAATVRFELTGVRCVDTSESAMARLTHVDGVVRATAYAATHEIDVEYDPAKTSPNQLQEAFEAPFQDPETGTWLFHSFTVVALDGERIVR
ncbi:MAG: 4Fe-4S binding protein [Candidatus Eisenbacteria bacterium]